MQLRLRPERGARCFCQPIQKPKPGVVPGFSVATHQEALFALQEQLDNGQEPRFIARKYLIDPMKAILEVEDFRYATSQLSQTTLRSIVGQAELDELLSEREQVNRRLQEVIDQQTDPWGVKVGLVEVKHVDLPEHMKRAMAKQAESERERRAKVIHAEGEHQAATRLRDAAQLIEKHPMAMQMRFLQTLVEVGAENNTTIVFPVPVELASTFLRGAATNGRPQTEGPHRSPAGEPMR